MRKLLVTTVFILIAITTTQAQDVNFGIKAGVNFADLTLENKRLGVNVDTKMRTSFYVEGFANFPLESLSDKVYLQGEIQYSNNGATFYSSAERSDYTIKVGQINLPITLKYEVMDNLFINGGAYIGFITSTEITAEKSGETRDFKAVFRQELGSFDAGLVVGGEYHLENGLLFTANFNLGLVNYSGEVDGTFKNQVIQVGLGYQF